MSEGRVVPKVRFKGFEKEWKEHNLSEMMDFSNGINAPKENYGKGRKMISVMDILADEPITYDSIRNAVEVDSKTENRHKVEKGDLVFVRSSEVVDEVGWVKAYLDNEPALFSGFSIRGKKKSDYDPLFTELSINGKKRKQIERKAGGSTRYNVGQSALNSVVVLEPSHVEQVAISNLFKQLSSTIAFHQQEIKKLNQFKQAMLQKMFPEEGEKVPKVRFEGFEGEWDQVKLKELLDAEFKGSAKLDDLSEGNNEYLDADRLNGGTPFLSNGEKNVSRDEILIIWDGSNAGKVYFNFEGVLGSTLKAFTVKDTNYPEFIYQYLNRERHNIFQNFRTPNIPHVIRDFTEKFNIPVANLQEQEKIGEYFNKLDKNIFSKQAKLNKLNQIKQAMLNKMFI
ncbi:restriction endonuclease subunit S [Macrococcoides bohemicum]|uniref:Restriction endonuclease subunit S n=1 Tax=Macrococcoides bohemicum TaxID=1903056 RepID=A0A328A6V3_9STAP|nr:restriction endonuclease subunit S [Macrococcus bohemicus]RAK50231.1 restriction endonuclease subunit S [Macrococcus bohemicus]